MKLVAVMDLIGGQVVHARRGERHSYRPVKSRLAAGSDPAAIVRALLQLHRFDAIYLADLDAILERGANTDAILRIRRAATAVPLWIDAGIRDIDALQGIHALGMPIVGTESMPDAAFLVEAARAAPRLVLSLDFRAGVFQGPPDLLERPDIWPQEILAMNLDCVGAEHGPDLALLRHIASQKPGARVYAAGGIRDRDDFAAVRDAGGAGALLATALHDGRLSGDDLRAFAD